MTCLVCVHGIMTFVVCFHGIISCLFCVHGIIPCLDLVDLVHGIMTCLVCIPGIMTSLDPFMFVLMGSGLVLIMLMLCFHSICQQNCQHNTTGSQCERCRPGFYGDATRGSAADCQPCVCPSIDNK